MKLKRITAEENFDPTCIVSSSEIFARKTEQISSDGEEIEVKTFADNGLFSPKIFGVLNTEVDCSCQCGKYVGKYYNGIICEKCGTEVKEVAANIDKTGWIDLGERHLIKYVAYMMLERLIGRENLKQIIHQPNYITISGERDEKVIEELRESTPETKYWHIGIEKFYEEYNEILDYYFYLHHKKEEELEMVLDDSGFPKLDDSGNQVYKESKKSQENRRIRNFICSKFDVFTNKIPVLSAVLRPAMRTEDGLKLDALNILYTNILKNVEMLKDKSGQLPIMLDLIQEGIQAQYFQLSENAIEAIKSKGGLIRNQICGTRINFSARNIISPAKAGYKLDELVLPYLTFLELFKFEIINVLTRVKNIDMIEANKIVFDAAINFNEDVYLIMKKMISDEEIGVLLNRNPTIALGSILYLRVAGVKHNNFDNTMSVNNTILTLLNGDYDGDVLNLVSLKDRGMREVFKETFSPISLLIDPNNGNFNGALNLERDQVLGFNTLLL